MNIKEQKLVEQLINLVENPSVTHTEYDENFKATEVTPIAEVNRLLKSPDYIAGWNNCKKEIVTQLRLMLMMSSKKAVKRGAYRR